MSGYAISTWIFRDTPLTQTLAGLASSGFRAVELSGTGSALRAAWEKDPPGAVRELAAAGVAVYSVHCTAAGRHGLASAAPAERAASIAENRCDFARMRASDIPEMVLHPGGKGSGARSTPAASCLALARESLACLADLAGTMGLRLAVENSRQTIATLLELIVGLGDHVGLCHDVGHSALAGLDPVAEARLALASGKLFSLHLHDVAPDGSDHHLPGQGRLDFDRLITALDAAGFTGLRTLELRPLAGDTVARIARAVQVC